MRKEASNVCMMSLEGSIHWKVEAGGVDGVGSYIYMCWGVPGMWSSSQAPLRCCSPETRRRRHVHRRWSPPASASPIAWNPCPCGQECWSPCVCSQALDSPPPQPQLWADWGSSGNQTPHPTLCPMVRRWISPPPHSMKKKQLRSQMPPF